MKEVKLEAVPRESTASRFLRAFKTLGERINFSKKVDRNADRLGQGKAHRSISDSRKEAVKMQLPVVQARNTLERPEFERSLKHLADKAALKLKEKLPRYFNRIETIDEEIGHADRIIDRLLKQHGSISEKLAESRIRLQQKKDELEVWQVALEEVVRIQNKFYEPEYTEDDFVEKIEKADKQIPEEPFEVAVFRNTRNFAELDRALILLPGETIKDRYGRKFTAHEITSEINDIRTILRRNYNRRFDPVTLSDLKSIQIQALPGYLQEHIIRLCNKEWALYRSEDLQKIPEEAWLFAFNTHGEELNTDFFKHYKLSPRKNVDSYSLLEFETMKRKKYTFEHNADKFEKDWSVFLDSIMAGYHG